MSNNHFYQFCVGNDPTLNHELGFVSLRLPAHDYDSYSNNSVQWRPYRVYLFHDASYTGYNYAGTPGQLDWATVPRTWMSDLISRTGLDG